MVVVNGIKSQPLNDVDFRVIMAMAHNNMRATETSYDLKMHRNSILYRLKKIKRLTGLDPEVFYDLVKLVDMARKEQYE